jgi:hypothetical protein
MASPWSTYSPGPLPAGDVKLSEPDTSHPTHRTAVTSPVWNSNSTYPGYTDPARDFPAASSELVESDAKLACMKVPSAHGRIGSDSFASSVMQFTSTAGSPMRTTGKTAPVVVSATSLSVNFRPAMSSSSPYDANTSAQHTRTSKRPDNAVAHVIGSSQPTNNQVDRPQRSSSPGIGHTMAQTSDFSERVVTSPEASSKLERHVFASAPITNSSAAAPIPAATGEPSSPLSGWASNPILATDINTSSSLSNGASQPTSPPSVTLSPNLNRERDNQERRVPKRSMTEATSGSGGSIVKSQYTDMVFEEVPRVYNLLSFLFTWLLLAGFIVLPGTFNTLEGVDSNTVKKVLHTIQHLPLYVLSAIC